VPHASAVPLRASGHYPDQLLSAVMVRRGGELQMHGARIAATLNPARLALASKPPRLCTFLFVCHTWP